MARLSRLLSHPADDATARQSLAASHTGRAAGMAGAVLVVNALGLAFTVLMARLLGAAAYGSLAALVSAFLILSVPGTALQMTVARDVSASTAAGPVVPGAGVRGWLNRLALLAAAGTAISLLARNLIAGAIGVEEAWAAAAVVPAALLWLMLSVQRGALLGFQRYRLVVISMVGEAGARLVLALALAGAGLGVTGAFLGTLLAILVTALLLARPLRGELDRAGALKGGPSQGLNGLFARAWVPALAIALIAVLQNVDVIVVKHRMPEDLAGAYAAAAVAAKAIIWVAIGVGLYLLPEASRLNSVGGNAQPILWRALAVVGLIAAPITLLYTAASESVLRVVFGSELAVASEALPLLALAFSCLACTYLAVQYLVALQRAVFLAALAAAATAEPLVLAAVGAEPVVVGGTIAVLQLALAGVLLSLSLRSSTVNAGAHGREINGRLGWRPGPPPRQTPAVDEREAL